jgi:RNA polymerase sigma factor (sigma-70 family)
MKSQFSTRQTLLQGVRSGDDKSWEEFAAYYKKFIYFICLKMGLKHHDCEELVQQVMIKLWEKLPKQDEEFMRFRAWLCRVSGNTVRDFMRKTQNREKYEGRYTEKDYSEPEIESMAEDEWKKFISAQAIENVNKFFSEEVMQMFKLFHLGKKVPEIALELNVSENTVSVYKGRVLRAVCKEVRRLEEDLSS